MTDKEWIEQEIDYIKFRLEEIKLTCDNPKYKADNLKRLKEVTTKISNINMLMS